MFTPTPKTTDRLIELFIERLHDPKVLLDMGTGTGYIARELKKAFPNARVIAVDINSQGFPDDPDIEWLESDLFEKLGDIKFDGIIMDPPYAPSRTVSPDADKLSVDGGEEGFDLIAHLISEMGEYLNPDAVVAIEIWHDHDRFLPDWEIFKDADGLNRFAIFVNTVD